MGNKALHILFFILCTAFFASCSEDGIAPNDVIEDVDEVKNPLLTLHISIGEKYTPVRGIPTGGEDGDNRENGQYQENDINDISVFRFHGSIVTATDETMVEKLAYVPDVNFHPDETSGIITATVDLTPYTDYNFKAGDHFIVVANMGDVAYPNTLGKLRDFLVENAWTGTDGAQKKTYNNFVMSNEKESQYTEGSGTPEDPRIIHVDIERVASRIDLCIDGSTIDGSSRRWEARDNNTKVGDVIVSHARVINLMKQPTYLIKRLAKNKTEKPDYLGYEVTPTQYYVVEPHTWLKGSATAANLKDWYGDTRQSEANRLQHQWFRDHDKIHVGSGDGFTTGTTYDPDFDANYYVVDYANENTMTPEATSGKTTTAVGLYAIYQPAVIYSSLDEDGTPVEDDTYQRGQTFWRYRPITAEYDETKALYFSDKTAAEDYMALHTDVVAEINEYQFARCYYVVYLRHDNSPVSPYVTPMEFGIVRNNIYRLKVGFTGPGYTHIPEDTDITPEGIKPYIYVKRWYYIEHPEIEL